MGESEKAQQKTYASAYMRKTAYIVLYVMIFFIGFFLAGTYSALADTVHYSATCTPTTQRDIPTYGESFDAIRLHYEVDPFDPITWPDELTNYFDVYLRNTDSLTTDVYLLLKELQNDSDIQAHIATSTTILDTGDLSSSFSLERFEFDEVTLDGDKMYGITLLAEDDHGGLTAIQWGLIPDTSSCTTPDHQLIGYNSSGSAYGVLSYDGIFEYGYASTTSTTTPPDYTGISTTTIEWIIASTTEAVYNVAYALNMFLGVFMFILFFYVGYRYIRIFL